MLVVFKKTGVVFANYMIDRKEKSEKHLSSEAVQSLALTLEGIDNVQGSHSFALGVLGVGDGITDDVLKEGHRGSPHR